METSREYPVVTAVMDIVTDWWKRRGGGQSDLFNLADADVEGIAKDMGVSAAELRALDRSCAVLLLPKMMAALRLDPGAVARSEPAVYRDLQRVCAICDSKKRCARELAEEDAAASYEDFCPNALTLKALE